MTKARSASNIFSKNLGQLELQVLEILWRHPGLDAKQVRAELSESRVPSLSTVQSTLERLFRKAYIDRIKHGHAYTYCAIVTRGNLMGRMLGDVIQILHDGRIETILSSFVNAAAEMDESSLEALEQMIRRRRAQQETAQVVRSHVVSQQL